MIHLKLKIPIKILINFVKITRGINFQNILRPNSKVVIKNGQRKYLHN